MSALATYQFKVLDHSSLSTGDPRDPFRFYNPQQIASISERSAKPQITLEVQDIDSDRQITATDRFSYVNDRGERLLLHSTDALKLLNFYVDPDILKSQRWGVVVTRSESEPSLEGAESQPLEALPGMGAKELENIRELHFPYWEVDAHLDLNILEGLRIYTQAENDRWTGFQGVPIFWNGKYFRNRVLGEKGTIAASFITVEHITSPAFVWQMYTTNFLSMVAGSVSGNNREEGRIEAGQLYANGDSTSHSTKRLINIQTAKSRSNLAKDHLYFSITWPVVLGACFADPYFRQFWPAPWKAPRFGVLYEYFSSQFTRSIPFIGRSALGLGAAALSGVGIYEISSVWFDVYGHLPQGSTENRAFSAGSTILTQAALFSRTSKEIEALTGVSSLSWQNFQRFGRMPWTLEATAPIKKMNFFGLKVPFPRPGIDIKWTETLVRTHLPLGKVSLKAEATAAEAMTERFAYRSALLDAGAVRSSSISILQRAQFAELAAGETILTRRAGLAITSRLAGGAMAEEGLLASEELTLVSRTRFVGTPLLAAAVVVGAAVGFCYLTGIFDKEKNPRQWARDHFEN